MPIRVVLGEDSLIVREGVHQLLAVDPEVEIVAAVADQSSLRQACEEHRPDVVLTDIRMPPTNTDEGIRLAAELRDDPSGDRRGDPQPVLRPDVRAGPARAGLGPAAPTCSRSASTTAPS